MMRCHVVLLLLGCVLYANAFLPIALQKRDDGDVDIDLESLVKRVVDTLSETTEAEKRDDDLPTRPQDRPGKRLDLNPYSDDAGDEEPVARSDDEVADALNTVKRAMVDFIEAYRRSDESDESESNSKRSDGSDESDDESSATDEVESDQPGDDEKRTDKQPGSEEISLEQVAKRIACVGYGGKCSGTAFSRCCAAGEGANYGIYKEHDLKCHKPAYEDGVCRVCKGHKSMCWRDKECCQGYECEGWLPSKRTCVPTK